MTSRHSLVFRRFSLLACLIFTVFALCPGLAFGQATIQAGSISGTITDQSGAVVPSATVTITNADTGQKKSLTTTSSGSYNSGPLAPGNYKVRAEKSGFSTTELNTVVSIGNIASGNLKLGIAGSQQTVEVQAGIAQVNTEQATVQGVLTSRQIEALPINGRNFLDSAQLEPGVQIQDASNFDPTKTGYMGVSVGGRQGRTTRIEVDGLDISDETVGSTTYNPPTESIQEFQVSQSSLDFSTELTSSGAVNVATKTGTNNYHGDAFYLFRDKRAGDANFPGGSDNYYQRNDVGGSFGGAIIKDKLFFFAAGERVLQHLFAPITFSAPFNVLDGGYQAPFREKQLTGRLDYNLFGSAKLFYRFNYDNATAIGGNLPNYQPYANLDNVPSHAVGLDFTTGSWTHSFRFGYLKFQNHINDASAEVGAPLSQFQCDCRITGTSPGLRWGINDLAPQATFQRNAQMKYDGSKSIGPHIFRYGVSYNSILGGGFASFYGLGATIRGTIADEAAAASGPFPGGAGNPLNYPVHTMFLGNGQGFNTERPAFGYPAGGQFDHRLSLYIGDTWKIRPNFTLTAGLRYNRDTGRTDSDLAPIPCSAIDQANFSAAPPCSGNLIDNFGNQPGLGNRVNQPNSNFGPTLGLVWDPTGSGKTVIRAGGGLYWENAIFNNVLFDRPFRLPTGLFFNISSNVGNNCPQGAIDFPGGQVVTTTPTGKNIASQICGQPIGNVITDVAALQTQYQQAVAAAGATVNPSFVGETLQASGMFAPNYVSPRSWQMNVGIQRQLWNSAVLSVDYIRNISLHYLLSYDTNHVGDARYLNKTAAINAIAATTASFGCAGGATPAAIQCAINNHATIDDFASFGLDSGVSYLGGAPAEAIGNAQYGITNPDNGAAFAGINPWYGVNSMSFPIGRSVYNAMQVSFRQRAMKLGFIPNAMIQISYSLSRFDSMGSDQDFLPGATDQANPTRFFGPSSFDRTHQLSFGTVFTLPHGPQLSFIGHFNSPLPSTIVMGDQGRPGEIFHTDFTGDGTTGDVLPGQNLGSFMRGVSPGDVAGLITAYNQKFAGTITPAGQALVSAGLFTQQQLVALGAVMDTYDPTAAAGIVGNDWLKQLDAKFAWPIKVGERFTITPSVSCFNVLNFANFAISPATLVDATLQPGAAFGTTYAGQANRAGLGSGVFQLGAPRQFEWGLRVAF